MAKTKAHTRYRVKDNSIVPGVTTVTGILNKPALVPWANRLGLQGIDVKKYVDDKAEIGSCAHYIIEQYLKKEPADLSDYTKNQIDLAENAVLKFYEWEKNQDFQIIKPEMMLVSEKHRFGGQCDIFCMLNGKPTLIDLKTSKGIFPEMFTQVSAYRQLLIENGYPCEDVRILRIGRDESEGFEDRKVPLVELHFERFLHCLAIYNINKRLK